MTALSRDRRRQTSVVLAEDLSTGEILRCDVIVDVIEQLGVLTTTRELYLEEAPETFELWAQDSQGIKKSHLFKPMGKLLTIVIYIILFFFCL